MVTNQLCEVRANARQHSHATFTWTEWKWIFKGKMPKSEKHSNDDKYTSRSFVHYLLNWSFAGSKRLGDRDAVVSFAYSLRSQVARTWNPVVKKNSNWKLSGHSQREKEREGERAIEWAREGGGGDRAWARLNCVGDFGISRKDFVCGFSGGSVLFVRILLCL